MTDYKKEMLAENKELRCYIERLREELNNLVAVYMPREGSGAGSRGVPDCLVSACVAITETPSQSLRHIEHRVEEETLEHFCNYVAHELGLALTKDDVANYERKYPKEVDNG